MLSFSMVEVLKLVAALMMPDLGWPPAPHLLLVECGGFSHAVILDGHLTLTITYHKTADNYSSWMMA